MRRPARRTILATVLLTGPLLAIVIIAVVMSWAAIWLLGGVFNFISLVTSPLVWAAPLFVLLAAGYVAALIAALALLLGPAGRAPFHRPPPAVAAP